MTHTPSVAVLIGSLRAQSINARLARVLARVAGDRLALNPVEIGDLPLYNDDLWQDGGPAPVLRLRKTVAAADAVLVIAPEYNRTYPGVIANAFDWGSRPYGQSCWVNKPAAIAGTSPGAIGAAVGQGQLRRSMTLLSMIVMNQPEMYIQWSDSRFGPDDTVTDTGTVTYLDGFVTAFTDWIHRVG